jgi:hypothetical protein
MAVEGVAGVKPSILECYDKCSTTVLPWLELQKTEKRTGVQNRAVSIASVNGSLEINFLSKIDRFLLVVGDSIDVGRRFY